MKYKPSRDLPRFIRELKTFSPSVLREYILTKRNKAISPESISNWIRRNPKIIHDLTEEIISSEVTNEEVVATIFHNGTFEAIPTISQWIKDMKRRKIVAWKSRVSTLKNVCRGTFRNLKINDWVPRHPSRLVQEDVLLIVDKLEELGRGTAHIRIASRNFLMSCNKEHNRISGEKGAGFGKHSDLYVEKSKIDLILNHVKSNNFECYVADLFMFKTATRLSATLNALIENLLIVEGYPQITVWDKARRSKHPDGKKTPKFISLELHSEIMKLIGNRKEGKIFQNIHPTIISELNREAFKIYIPIIERKLSMPNHFWRHMFAQHMLRLSNWNYGIVASLGGWTVQALQESYGKPPIATIRAWGKEFVNKI